MEKKRSAFQLLLWGVSVALFLLGAVSGIYGIGQAGSNLLFGAIFVFLGGFFLFNGFKIARMNPEYAVDSFNKALYENRAERNVTVILVVIAGFIYLTGTFTIFDSFLKVPKIGYNYYLLMVFLWPVIGTESIVYILSVYSRYTLHLSFVGHLLKIAVLIFEFVYLIFVSRLFVKLIRIRKRIGQD